MKKNKLLSFFEYAVIFVCSCISFFFVVPSSDNFYFSRDYENNLASIWWNALHYGNGRLLGNLTGIWFILNYRFIFIFTALTVTLLVYFFNKLIFNGDYRSVMPLGIVLIFSNVRIMGSVYREMAVLGNYVVPVVLILAALCCMKSTSDKKNSILRTFGIFFFTFSSCLFSENTTITVVLLTVFSAVNRYLNDNRIKFSNIILLLGSIAGGLTMYLIPKATASAEKLSFYRGVAGGAVGILKQCVVNSLTFADIFSSFLVPVIVISLCFIVIVLKNRRIQKSRKAALVSCLAASPAEFVLYSLYSHYSPYSVYMFCLQTVFVLLFTVSVILSIASMEKTHFRTVCIGFMVLIILSVGPVMIVNLCGCRIFYVANIIIIAFAACLLKEILPIISDVLPNIKLSEKIMKTGTGVLAAVFIFISGNMFIGSVYNYNYYVIRTQNFAEQIKNRDPVVEVSTVPCIAYTEEDELPSLLCGMVYKLNLPEDYSFSFKVISFGGKEDYSGRYYNLLEMNPFSATVFAFRHLEYENVLITDDLAGLK